MSESVQEEARIKPSPSFQEIVLESQEAWRNAKENPLRTFSQTAELLPSISATLFQTAVNHLPPAIDSQTRAMILDTHPIPVIGIGVLIDKRSYGQGPYALFLRFPETVPIDKREYWKDGIVYMNEICANLLAHQNIGSVVRMEHPLTGSEKVLRSEEIRRSQRQLDQTQQAIYTQLNKRVTGDVELLKNELVVSFLTGDRRRLNEFLQRENADDIDTLAISIGEQNNSYNPTAVERNSSLQFRRKEASFVLGQSETNHPGVISIFLGNKNIIRPMTMYGAGMAMLSSFAAHDRAGTFTLLVGSALQLSAGIQLLPEALKLPRTLLHEEAHYMSYSLDHLGLLPTYLEKTSA